MNNMVETPSNMFLTQLFLEQIKQSKALQNEVAMYHRAEQGHQERTYRFLYEPGLEASGAMAVRQEQTRNV